MHVRAYNYWVSLLDGRDFPSIEDLEPERRRRISRRTACCSISPAAATTRRCPISAPRSATNAGSTKTCARIADVPSRSLLSRLTDHYHADHRQPRADRLRGRVREPARREHLLSRHPDALLVGRRHDRFHLRRDQLEDASSGAAATRRAGRATPEPMPDEPLEACSRDRRVAERCRRASARGRGPIAERVRRRCAADADEPDDRLDGPIRLGTADRRRAIADDCRARRSTRMPALPTACGPRARPPRRSRPARAAPAPRSIGRCRWLMISPSPRSAIPDEYAELLEESGVKAQARAPMTPIVKLVFGIDYDKARLTEFAAALSYARAPGGRARRRSRTSSRSSRAASRRWSRPSARRAGPSRRPTRAGEAARAQLRAAPADVARRELPADEEFAVVVTRRGADGAHEPVAVVDDEALVERAIRRAA